MKKLILIHLFIWLLANYCHGEVQKYALVIGITGYENYQESQKLQFADDDAETFYNFIIQETGGKFPAENIKLLLNDQATRNDIFQGFEWISKRANANDLVYLFFAGHGLVDNSKLAYLMPYDADPYLPGDNGIRTNQFVQEVASKISTKLLVVFIDACYAGAAYEIFDREGSRNISASFLKSWEDEFTKKEQSYYPMAILSAGSNQRSFEDSTLHHGVYTYYLIEGMKGLADKSKDNRVTAGELYSYLLDNVEQYSKEHFKSAQSPSKSPFFDNEFILGFPNPINNPPMIQWIKPKEEYTFIIKDHFSLVANINSDTRIEDTKIFINKRTLESNKDIETLNEISKYGKEILCDASLSLGKNEIVIYAKNANEYTFSDKRMIVYEHLDSTLKSQSDSLGWMRPNLYMVSIGISRYLSADQNLKYAADDARSISQIFSGQKGKLFRNVEIKTLCNSEATRANIINAIKWLEERSTPKDMAMVFIAAHGYNELDDYYILPYEGDPDNLILSGVDQSIFEKTLGHLQSRVMLFLDTNYSGKLWRNFNSRGTEKNIAEMLRQRVLPKYGMVIMAASTANELSQELTEWRHGAFTQALIEGLQQGKADQNDDGIIHINELDLYVSERVKQLTNGKQHATTQKPSSISRFPIFQLE